MGEQGLERAKRLDQGACSTHPLDGGHDGLRVFTELGKVCAEAAHLLGVVTDGAREIGHPLLEFAHAGDHTCTSSVTLILSQIDPSACDIDRMPQPSSVRL